ncbi:6-phosphogluconolactonase [Sinisalibacter lacisalsi]|uniref:6-phosphogluconolactonase n=1 Tax=Sinisalibacter lacisalsi TaxID=1526570 RepID=A0ABQ1QP58_9RHOB|nr:6-phosphogluconolactonase [Sinisalibacter lacisalsi]GGD33941.1 6-phosphogluconolactonase [Sinisalibacter lacisalsi]
MKFVEYTDSDMLWLGLADEIAGALNGVLVTGERASLAVPGGTTPGPLFDVLSAISLDWERVDVLLTDERWVPETSPRSNARLLRERLFVDKAAAANFVPFYTGGEAPDPDLAYVASQVEALAPLTVVLLGMGEDMHTASLFPGAENLEKALRPNAPGLVSMDAPDAGEPRVSLSAEMINGAMNRHLVIVGPAKRAALERAQALGDPTEAPVAAVLDGLTVHWAES